MLWEYKQVLNELLYKKKPEDKCKNKPENKCKKKPHPNDNYVIIGGRTYLKGESPLEGVWHSDHTPFEVNKYAIIENNVPRTVTITTI